MAKRVSPKTVGRLGLYRRLLVGLLSQGTVTGISHMAAVTATARCSMSIIDTERAASSAVFVDLSLARGEATVEWGS
jgi:hypothetical protein